MTTTTQPTQENRKSRRAARTVIISAWAVPVLVIGQFAMLAIVPVTLALVATLRDARLRRLRRPPPERRSRRRRSPRAARCPS